MAIPEQAADNIDSEVEHMPEKMRAGSTMATSEASLGHEAVARLSAAREDFAAPRISIQEITQATVEAQSATRRF